MFAGVGVGSVVEKNSANDTGDIFKTGSIAHVPSIYKNWGSLAKGPFIYFILKGPHAH